MNRALVIGADGLVGNALAAALKAGGVDVIGTTRRRDGLSRDMFHLDLADPIPNALPDVEVAFICAAMTKLADCRSMPDRARRVNCEAPLDIATRLVGRGTKVVFLSTSAVLDCAAPRMRAERSRDGRSLYGAWKGAAETAILALGPGASVLRLTKILTPDAPLFHNWLLTLRDGGTIEAFDDHRVSPIRLADVVDALIAIGDAEGGLYQISGARDVSYRDMASHLAAALHVPTERVVGCRAGKRGIPAEETTQFTSLDCRRLTALNGFAPPQPYAILDALFLRTPETAGAALAET